jgi:hypothetical protein
MEVVFFDRTLAMMNNSPLKLGVGYRQQALVTIHGSHKAT